MMIRFILVAVIALPLHAHADEPEVPPEPPAPEPTPAEPPVPAPVPEPVPPVAELPQTSSSVASAPRPEAASQQIRAEAHPGEWALWIPRVLLFPIRVAVTIIGYPISMGLYALELYNLSSRVKSVFFNEDGTVGIYPVGFAETGFGLNIGGRLILRRIIEDVGLTGRASFGGRFRQLLSTKISTNNTFEHATIDLRGSYEVRPKDQFFGIGNGDLTEDAPMMPVAARGAELRESRFRQDAIRIGLQATYHPHRTVSVGLSGAIIDRTFAAAEDDNVEAEDQLAANFDVATVTGFVDGSQTMYAELEATFDTRHAPSRFESAAAPSAGWYLQGFAGYTNGFSGDPSSYIRYGLDLQRFLRLGEGPRALALRVKFEGVTGGYNEVSFYDLPKLGGPLLLRGFNLDQYRDRFAGLGSIEYQFDAAEFLGGFVFVDFGRVFSQPEDIELSDLRLGFGGGIQLHSKKSFLGRFTVASGSEGSVFLSLSFDPVYDTRARVERR